MKSLIYCIILISCQSAISGDMKRFEGRITKKGSTVSHVVVIEAKNKSEAKKILQIQNPGYMVSTVREAVKPVEPKKKDEKRFEGRITKKGSTVSHVVAVEAKNKSEAKKILQIQNPGCMVSTVRETKLGKITE